MTITKELFIQHVGRAPEGDDLERCNCPQPGTAGHLSCGWCSHNNLPRFMCICGSGWDCTDPGKYRRAEALAIAQVIKWQEHN